jgi:hypothetical protein
MMIMLQVNDRPMLLQSERDAWIMLAEMVLLDIREIQAGPYPFFAADIEPIIDCILAGRYVEAIDMYMECDVDLDFSMRYLEVPSLPDPKELAEELKCSFIKDGVL